MGIQGLCSLLEENLIPSNLNQFQGFRVGIDAFSWLHQGSLPYATQLCRGQDTTRYLEFTIKRLNLLIKNGILPIMVLDGGDLPMKQETKMKRKGDREYFLAKAEEFESKRDAHKASYYYEKAVTVTPSMALNLVKLLNQQHVPYVVAPYEADAQLAYLAINNRIDAVITKDSDLIAFGCPMIIYDLKLNGDCKLFYGRMIEEHRSFKGFTPDMFLEACILTGCDYVKGIKSIKLEEACRLISHHKSYKEVIRHWKDETPLPDLYEESFRKAIITFKHQVVYDTEKGILVRLREPEANENLEFAGSLLLEKYIAQGIAEGYLNPKTTMNY